MRTIKFSHSYTKLLVRGQYPCQHAELLDVIVRDLSEMSARFLEYDTDNGLFPLPKKGKYMILVFNKGDFNISGQYNLFTTIRRWTPEKETYYRCEIGNRFEVQINETD